MRDTVERRASRECVATTVPSLRDSILFHICYPALTCRATFNRPLRGLQGLKPRIFVCRFGTTKVVPRYGLLLRHH